MNAYIGQLNNAAYIESRMMHYIKEALNAEVVLGNVSTLREAYEWINYTFYSIRVKRNPFFYDCVVGNDSKTAIEVHHKRKVEETLIELDKLKLVKYDS